LHFRRNNSPISPPRGRQGGAELASGAARDRARQGREHSGGFLTPGQAIKSSKCTDVPRRTVRPFQGVVAARISRDTGRRSPAWRSQLRGEVRLRRPREQTSDVDSLGRCRGSLRRMRRLIQLPEGDGPKPASAFFAERMVRQLRHGNPPRPDAAPKGSEPYVPQVIPQLRVLRCKPYWYVVIDQFLDTFHPLIDNGFGCWVACRFSQLPWSRSTSPSPPVLELGTDEDIIATPVSKRRSLSSFALSHWELEQSRAHRN